MTNFMRVFRFIVQLYVFNGNENVRKLQFVIRCSLSLQQNKKKIKINIVVIDHDVMEFFANLR